MPDTEIHVQDIIADWPEEQRKLASELVAKYGDPDEMTPSRLMWFDNHPWKRTTLYREGVRHDFPFPHSDTLEQAVDYRVPVDRACDLLRFIGSLTIRRTAGELAAQCNGEAVNLLSINLADEICTGRADVEGARAQFAENIDKLLLGEETALTQGFTFSVMRGGTAEPDLPAKQT